MKHHRRVKSTIQKSTHETPATSCRAPGFLRITDLSAPPSAAASTHTYDKAVKKASSYCSNTNQIITLHSPQSNDLNSYNQSSNFFVKKMSPFILSTVVTTEKNVKYQNPAYLSHKQFKQKYCSSGENIVKILIMHTTKEIRT